MNELGRFLKEKRETAKLTQNDIAKKMGYTSAQFISNWERGVSHPPLKTLKKLVSTYKFSSDEIFKIMLDQTVAEVTRKIRKAFGKNVS